MGWTWRAETADGMPVAYDIPEFSAQGDAETWLGEQWHDLADAGIDQVVLLDDAREVYGPMSLETG